MTGALKAKVDGQWVLASSATGGGGAEEVYVGALAPLGTEEIWYDTSVAGVTPDDLRWNSAWGVVASVEGANDITVTATVPYTLASVSFTAVAGRRYKAHYRCVGSFDHPTAVLHCSLRLDGTGTTPLAEHRESIDIQGAQHTVIMTSESFTTTAGSHPVYAYFHFPPVAAAFTARGGWSPWQLVISDVGPATGGPASVMSVTDRWYSAWGIITESTVTSGQSTTGSVDLTGLAATFTPVVGRKYRYSVKIDITTTVPGDIVVLSINDVAQIDRHTGRLGGTASETWAWSTRTETFATATPVTRKTVLVRAAGTGTIATQADPAFPAKFLVEDMGPVVGGTLPEPITLIDRWNTAWGVLATSATSSIACTAPNTNIRLSPDLTFTAVTGRRYRISQRVSSAFITVGPGTSCGVAVAVMEGAAVIGDGDQWIWVGGPGYSGGLLQTYINGNGAVRTVRSVCEVVNSTNGTTVTMGCQGLVVEDMGPVSGAVAVADPTPAWIPMTLLNSWQWFGGGNPVPSYRKVGDMVAIRGAVKNATTMTLPSTSTITNLPAAYRPPYNTNLAACSTGADQWGAPNIISMETTGDLKVLRTSDGPTTPHIFTSFDIQFSVTP